MNRISCASNTSLIYLFIQEWQLSSSLNLSRPDHLNLLIWVCKLHILTSFLAFWAWTTAQAFQIICTRALAITWIRASWKPISIPMPSPWPVFNTELACWQNFNPPGNALFVSFSRNNHFSAWWSVLTQNSLPNRYRRKYSMKYRTANNSLSVMQ